MAKVKSDLIRLHHILDAVNKTLYFSKGKSRRDLDTDEILSLALVRLLEIMGEASSKVTLETQSRYPSLPWKEMIGMRNRLIHAYDQVSLDILWQILIDDLPPLADKLQKAIDAEEQQQKLF